MQLNIQGTGKRAELATGHRTAVRQDRGEQCLRQDRGEQCLQRDKGQGTAVLATGQRTGESSACDGTKDRGEQCLRNN